MMSRFEQFASSIAGIYRHIQKIERDEMVRYGLKGSFAQYLLAIARHEGGVTSVELCDICGKDKAAISRVVCEMEERELIFRKTLGDHRYRAKLCLTGKGVEIADRVNARAKVAVDLAGKGLTEADRQNFYAVLNVIADNLHAMSKNGLPAADDK